MARLGQLVTFAALVLSVRLAVAASPASDASAKASTPPASEQRLKEIIEGSPQPSPSSSNPGFAPAPDNIWSLDCAQGSGKILEACQDALREYYLYRKEGLEQRKAVFAWQYHSSIAIFVVVVFLVTTGIVFAAIQFRQGLLLQAKRVEGEVEALVTQLEASAQGLKVSSPVLGVIILVISLAFFYLYLAFVYPIHEIF